MRRARLGVERDVSSGAAAFAAAAGVIVACFERGAAFGPPLLFSLLRVTSDMAESAAVVAAATAAARPRRGGMVGSHLRREKLRGKDKDEECITLFGSSSIVVHNSQTSRKKLCRRPLLLNVPLYVRGRYL